MAPTWDRALRDLRQPEAYMRAARLLPGVAAWIDPDDAVPLTPVLPFGQVTNSIWHYPPGRLEQDSELHALALDLFRGTPPRPGPSRSHLLQALAA